MRRLAIVLLVLVVLGGTTLALAEEPSGAGDLVVANAYAPADALTGGPLAARLGAPLVTTHVDEVPEATRRQVESLRPTRIVLLGGPVVIDAEVEAWFRRLSWDPQVIRLGGEDRFETSELIADFLADQPLPAAGSIDGLSLGELVTDVELASRLGATSDPMEQVVPMPTADGERNVGPWVRTGPLRMRLVCEADTGGLPEIVGRLETVWVGDGDASRNPFSQAFAYVNGSDPSDVMKLVAGMTGVDGSRVIEASTDGWISIHATTPDSCHAVWRVTSRDLPTSGT